MMYDRHLYSRAVRFQRAAVDSTFAIITSLQGYGDKLLKKTLEQTSWLPEKSKSTCAGLSDSCLHGSQTLRQFINQGFDEMERLVSMAPAAEKNRTEKKEPAPRPAAATARKQTTRKKSESPNKSQSRSAVAEKSTLAGKQAGQTTTTPPATPAAIKSTPQSATTSAAAMNAPAAAPSATAAEGAKPAGAAGQIPGSNTPATPGKTS